MRGLDRGETFLFLPSVDDFIDRENPAHAVGPVVDSLDLQSLGFALRDDHAIGLASYHPAMLLKLRPWKHLAQARSDRRMEEAATHSLNAIWPTGKLPPEHPTIGRFREGQAKTIR